MKRTSPALFSVALAAMLVGGLHAQKRPLTHADYDGWRHIQNQHLSNDGLFLAYALFPQEGDGLLIVRNLQTGKEFREPIGQLPPPPPPNYAAVEDEPPQPRGITVSFTRDSKTLVFSTFPSKAELDQAKKDKKKPADGPKNGLRIMNLTSGEVVRIERVKSFQVPSKADGFLAYLHEPEPAAKEPEPKGDKPIKKKEYGGALVLRNLTSGEDRAFHDVLEFAFAKDAGTLVYAVGAKTEDANGVYVVKPGGYAPPVTLVSGRGKFSKLAWDENQDELGFFGGAETKLYLWARDAAAAAEIVSATSPGLPSRSILSDKSNITFSKDGRHVFFGYAAKSEPEKPDATPPEDRVSVDLWSWKDDYIQPMQKVRATTEKNRSLRAVYNLDEKKVVALGTKDMQEVTPGEDGRYSLGGDDREYRSMVEYDERYADSYLVDNLTGSRKLVAKKHLGRVTWSPDSKYALFFNGKDWITLSAPEGKSVNLTSALGVKFWTEEHDSPGSPAPYGQAGWTKDGKSVLLYDHYDIWQASPDGSGAKNITAGMGRREHLMFRYVKLSSDPEDKWIDPAEPLLLRAEDSENHDTGFYRMSLSGGAPPQKLIMAARNFSNPMKAKDADVLALSASTFQHSPDLDVTDSNFRELRQVSDANPQQAGILWGTAELVNYRNTDGVALKATLYKPENFDPTKKYPMLVYIYERLTQNVNNYIEPRPTNVISVPYYVSNGYLVLEPDIVYTVGYPGQSALKCVLPAVQEIVDKGFVDEQAIGIEGHSWGGYQIAYMITQTNRFRAVEAGAPVANMTSAYDGIRWGPGLPRQFQYERTQSRIGGNLWEYPMRYIENSPLFQADRIKTPVLMIHNDADDAVPWTQGIEFYLALRRLGREVYMFTYNGEPHNLRKRPNQKDFTIRMQEYFDYYLKGAPKPAWMDRGIPYLEKPGVNVETDAEEDSIGSARP
jgi:dipeptidyl aminopeptidase/acylaminoacyl peptidase